MSDPRAHVALLVDVSDLRAALGGAEEPGEGWGAASAGDLARALMRYAAQVGRVSMARAYADWSTLGPAAREMTAARLQPVLVPATAAGDDRSHVQLAVDALQALFAGDEPDAFLVVTSDPTMLPLVQALRADGSEVIVVAPQAAADDELKGEADRFVTLEDVLAGVAAEPAVARERAPEAPEERGGWGGRGAGGERGGRPARPAHPTPIYGPEVDFATYDWTPFVRLIDELEQRLPFVGVRYLVNKVLAPHNCGTDDPRLKRELMNRAVDDGLLEMFPVSNVGDRADPVTACRLDRAHATVVAALGSTSAPPPIHEDPLRRAIAPGSSGLLE